MNKEEESENRKILEEQIINIIKENSSDHNKTAERLFSFFEKILEKEREKYSSKIISLENELSVLKGEALKLDVSNTLAYISEDITVDHVIDNIYLSGYRPATEKEILSKLGIRYILTAGKELPPVFP